MIRRLPSPPGLLAPGLALLAAACATTAPQSGIVSSPSEKPANLHEAGLERVLGKTEQELAALFGPADLDQHEGAVVRIQFAGPICVLDAYLSPGKTGGAPIVTYLDARLPSGDDIDRASCVAALSRRAAAP